jgi:hypothetical protein
MHHYQDHSVGARVVAWESIFAELFPLPLFVTVKVISVIFVHNLTINWK